ncbi:MAG: TIR domain-containing protein [Chloroflexi bacterium]|uniref:TIR domain-containing protein n=1 Tax=Candidatus Chlorohelix allophototropha TaxID=3003348 RepID=A0A8T7LWK2_9CHLR|nr:TIR domain-containing protein [Chloroflexota bacterium]
MPTPTKLQVFLCHSSGDKKMVHTLYNRLKAENWLDIWLDKEKLLPGQRWRDEIEKAVEQSHVILVCLSPESINKEGFVQYEIKIALDQADYMPEDRIFIIPLKLAECMIPRRLREWHWVNYYEVGAYEKLIKALQVRALQMGVELAQHPTTQYLPVQAYRQISPEKKTFLLNLKPSNWLIGGGVLAVAFVLVMGLLIATVWANSNSKLDATATFVPPTSTVSPTPKIVVTIPSGLIGKKQADATKQLVDAGFIVDVVQWNLDDIKRQFPGDQVAIDTWNTLKEGDVLGINPPAGTKLDKGAKVTLAVKKP